MVRPILSRLRERGEVLEARQQFGQHARFLLDVIARMQRRELHRDRRPRKNVVAGRRRGHIFDRLHIGGVIALGIGGGVGGLAQHVEGEAIAFRLERPRHVQGFIDGAAEHELPAHDAHRLFHGIADEGLARARHQALEIAADVGLGIAA